MLFKDCLPVWCRRRRGHGERMGDHVLQTQLQLLRLGLRKVAVCFQLCIAAFFVLAACVYPSAHKILVGYTPYYPTAMSQGQTDVSAHWYYWPLGWVHIYANYTLYLKWMQSNTTAHNKSSIIKVIMFISFLEGLVQLYWHFGSCSLVLMNGVVNDMKKGRGWKLKMFNVMQTREKFPWQHSDAVVGQKV